MGISDNFYRGDGPLQTVRVYQNRGDGVALNPRHDLLDASPFQDFSWGNIGPAAGQLAVAILANEYGDIVALKSFRAFLDKCVRNLPAGKSWELTSEQIDSIMFQIKGPKK